MVHSQKVSVILPPVWYVYNVKMACSTGYGKCTARCAGFAHATNNVIVVNPGIYSTEVNIFKLRVIKIM